MERDGKVFCWMNFCLVLDVHRMVRMSLMYSEFLFEGERVCFGEEFQQAMIHYFDRYSKN